MARILVVDDVPESVRLIELVLRADGNEVTTVTSPALAFEALRAQPTSLIIADQNMPGMTGETLLERVAALWPATRRLMLTADMRIDPKIDRGYRVMHKPFKLDALRDQVRGLLGSKQ